MERTSKDLLQLEHRGSSSESALLVCNQGSNSNQRPNPDGKPLTTEPAPKSNVLNKVRDFLGVISEANKSLEMNAKDKPEEYDIEVLKDGEFEYIEMDLMLGIADLQTPEAVAAAEAAIIGRQPVIDLPDESSSTDSEDSSEEDEDDDEECSSGSEDETGSRKPKHKKDGSSGDKSGRGQSKKRPKIVVLP